MAIFFKFQRNVSELIIHFRNTVGKIAYVLSVMLQLASVLGAAFGLMLILQFVLRRWFDRQISWYYIPEWLTSFGWIQLLLLLVALVIIRRILIRMNEPDRHPDYDR